MSTNFIKSLILLVGLSAVFGACTDHRQGELAPNRLRLKRSISTYANFPGTTEFSYDSLGRESGFTYGNFKGSFTYNIRGQVATYINAGPVISVVNGYTNYEGERNEFIYDSPTALRIISNTLVALAGRYLPDREFTRRIYNYTLDGQSKPLGQYNTGPILGGQDVRSSSYAYLGDNIVTEKVSNCGRCYETTATYQFDDKLNPLYGLIGPGITEVQRSSRNNVIKSVLADVGRPDIESITTYEYNTQGLPTKATSSTGEVRFEYERY
ncbi:hypothetical protein [Spirosoma sp. KUDC1026]|uniref:hypothetical protein n=1 Tax=Spirosoma sp. KUDC1026 TaxID=2745947 RepID=UPI00159BCC08|nr:hypothetical protein [Spirosoma sp. KUDC1026]QKZ13115.1 hypothetical protein HU175_10920 [Spirosoma sp. KUDC1026]